ncbi:hypothetical protein M422DRAFT_272301 [Sphaerobolus stellatus SS14]|uniref:Purine-cytosine permease n=1 Tax=Sphaerobolus stellatus (strain SS14) TaxID=990650 RepID=A0A0C9UM77_SPHS4|nr:hypothetical protein M422DRAFT_272301 [Sphaerobolus stellatus SS14]
MDTASNEKVSYDSKNDVEAASGKIGMKQKALNALWATGVETQGIDRVPEDEREDTHSIGMFTLWASVFISLTTFPLGMLGQETFTLTFDHTVATALGFAIIGCSCAGFIGTLGPQLGMRTMIITRYAFGYWGATIISLLNALTQLGFSVIAVILAGQLLHNLNNKLPLAVGIVIIGILSVTICFFGYNLLHHYERYAWMGMIMIFIMMLTLGGKEGYDLNAQKAFEDPPGVLRAADVLSFGAIMFSTPASLAPTVGQKTVPIAQYANCRIASWLQDH